MYLDLTNKQIRILEFIKDELTQKGIRLQLEKFVPLLI